MYNNKAQVAFEFLFLVVFTIISASALVVALANQAESVYDSYDKSRVEQIKNIVQSEINLALSSPAIYTREFNLPHRIDNGAYEIDVYDDVELLITYKSQENIFFLSGNTTNNIINIESLTQGKNSIVKTCTETDCLINISSVN